jgi:hypothetical protein
MIWCHTSPTATIRLRRAAVTRRLLPRQAIHRSIPVALVPLAAILRTMLSAIGGFVAATIRLDQVLRRTPTPVGAASTSNDI